MALYPSRGCGLGAKPVDNKAQIVGIVDVQCNIRIVKHIDPHTAALAFTQMHRETVRPEM